MFGNIGDMMKQMQKMKAKMAEVDEKLTTFVIEGTSGGGIVKATVNGKGNIKGIKIDSSLLDPKEGEVLEDLVVAAFQDAQKKAEERAAEELKQVSGGLKLPPGMNL